MTLGARPGIVNLFNEYRNHVEFVSVYVREAHPGEHYPQHKSAEQKMRHAASWVKQDDIPGTVAVDRLDGATHIAYGGLPNSVYLIDRTGRVAFRALWAGHEGLLSGKIEELLKQEAAHQGPVNLGQEENFLIPHIHGSAEMERALGRGGRRAIDEFKREMGSLIYGLSKLLSKLQPIINPSNKRDR